jgi:hypothetical protein
MRSNKTILVSIAIVVPLVAAIGVKRVMGSEPPGRLVLNSDGTVTDTVTKLLWQQATPGNNNLGAAASYCTSFSTTNVPSGWRLPTVKELVSIVDYELPTSPLIDVSIFSGTVAGLYWTSTASQADSQDYSVNFSTGQILSGSAGGYSNANGLYWRCVHSPVVPDAGP